MGHGSNKCVVACSVLRLTMVLIEQKCCVVSLWYLWWTLWYMFNPFDMVLMMLTLIACFRFPSIQYIAFNVWRKRWFKKPFSDPIIYLMCFIVYDRISIEPMYVEYIHSHAILLVSWSFTSSFLITGYNLTHQIRTQLRRLSFRLCFRKEQRFCLFFVLLRLLGRFRRYR